VLQHIAESYTSIFVMLNLHEIVKNT